MNKLLVVKISWPDKALHPNHSRKAHWSAIAQARKIQRQEANIEALRSLDGHEPPMWSKATIQPVFVMPMISWRADDDNRLASVKGAWDGLEDAGIITNDRELISWPPIQRVDKRQEPHVLLYIVGEAIQLDLVKWITANG